MAGNDPNSILVSYPAMQGLMDAIKRASDSFDAELNKLEGTVEKKIKDGWEGEQRDAYWASKAKWDQIILEMTAHLGKQRLAVEATGDQFKATDGKAARAFEGISVR